MIGYLLVIVAYVMATITDIRKRIIPTSTYVLLLLSALYFILIEKEPWLPRIISFFVLGGITLFISLLRDGLGGGDVKLIACTALAIGFYPTVSTVLFGTILACIALFIQIVRNKKKKKQKTEKNAIPLAPFLSMGLIAFFILDTVIIPY